MEINITSLLETDMFAFAHSQAEGGPDAGRNSWRAALDGPRPLLNTPEEFEAFRDHVKGFGAWDAEEIAAWDENECQALFLQMIAGDIRTCPAIIEGVIFTELESGAWVYEQDGEEYGDFSNRSEAYTSAYQPTEEQAAQGARAREPRAESLDEIDWPEYQAQAEAGRISGNLYRADSGEVFYSLES